MKHKSLVFCTIFVGALAIAACSTRRPGEQDAKTVRAIKTNTRYDDLLTLFKDWREFQRPKWESGVPDFTPAAIEKQKEGLRELQNRLKAIDTSSWPISQRVDYLIVRAEMNGMEFDHRVMKPWARNPCFYWVASRTPMDLFAEGPDKVFVLVLGQLPLPEREIPEFRRRLEAIPKILEQARANLVLDAKDLWLLGIRKKKHESAELSDYASELAKYHPELVPAVERAKIAVDDFRTWLERRVNVMTAPSGIGTDNYDWYEKNVHYVPYTFKEQMILCERELERALAFLKIEENKHRRLPPLEPVEDEKELRRRFDDACKGIMDFIRQEDIFTAPDWLKVSYELGPFIPPNPPRDFFIQIEYRDSMPMKCHSTHNMDDLRQAHYAHPIRGGPPLLYSIWDTRAEGLATGFEETMLQAGLFEKRPQARELIYILLANRAARAIAGMKMINNEFTLEQAVDYAVKMTPRGWLPREAETVWFDMNLYLHQPGYGSSYVIGKIMLDKMMADRAYQLEDKFVLRNFFDEFHAAGMIPLSLIRWEMTGLEDEIKKML